MSNLSAYQASLLAQLAYLDDNGQPIGGRTLVEIFGAGGPLADQGNNWAVKEILKDPSLANLKALEVKYDKSGMSGWALQEPKSKEIHVAFRGSENPTNPENLIKDWILADVGLMTGETAQQRAAAAWLRELQGKYPGSTFGYLVGHSLGGNLAMYCQLLGEFSIRGVIAINAPGFQCGWLGKQKGDASIIQRHDNANDPVSGIAPPLLCKPQGSKETLYGNSKDQVGHGIKGAADKIKAGEIVNGRDLKTQLLIAAITVAVIVMFIKWLFVALVLLGVLALANWLYTHCPWLMDFLEKASVWWGKQVLAAWSRRWEWEKRKWEAIKKGFFAAVAGISNFLAKAKAIIAGVMEKVGLWFKKAGHVFKSASSGAVALSYSAASQAAAKLQQAESHIAAANDAIRSARNCFNGWSVLPEERRLYAAIPAAAAIGQLSGSINYFQAIDNEFRSADTKAKNKLSG